MPVSVQPSERRIGLALSGGGFRAAAFHLGVLRKLEALGLLDKIDLISCVSGGSIAGAWLALRWAQPDRLDGLETYLVTRSVAVSSFIRGALDPFHSRLEVLADTYDADLFHGKSLGSLANCPRLYLNATNLVTGNAFSFVAGGGGPAEMGEWELGFRPASHFLLSRAVAASSAFPPVFPPLRLDRVQYAPSAPSGIDYLTLTDGGVYDNMGVNPTLRDRNALDYVIVSDGGAPFEMNEEPTESGTLVLRAAIDILMEQVRGLEFQRLEYHFKAVGRPKPLWFSIDSTIGEAVPGDARFASSVRTHLKALNDVEMQILVRHGGALVESRLRAYAPELLGGA